MGKEYNGSIFNYEKNKTKIILASIFAAILKLCVSSIDRLTLRRQLPKVRRQRATPHDFTTPRDDLTVSGLDRLAKCTAALQIWLLFQ